MTQISSYSISSPIISEDKWIGTDGHDGVTTKNFTAQDVSEFVRAGLSPIEGGFLKITEITIPTLDVDIATTVNSISPAYEVSAYEVVYFMVEDLAYILKLVNVIVGEDGDVLTNEDFIALPVNTGPTGNGIESITLLSTVGLDNTYRITYTDSSFFDFIVTNGSNGENGTNGENADMTRTSTTSLSVTGSGSKTLNYTESLNLGWINGMRLRFSYDSSNYIEGVITSVSSTSVTITADYSVGTGTYSNWNIGVAGDLGSNSVSEIVRENTASTLTITTQGLTDLDYDLRFQLDGNKCFVIGSITNNTGSTVTDQLLLTFTNASYNTDSGTDPALIAWTASGVVKYIIGHDDEFKISDLDDTDSVYINGFYYIN